MKSIKTIFSLLILTILVSSCHYDLDDVYENSIITDSIPNENVEYKWWILTHKNYESPGIYLYNETNATIELKLNLPENLESPHALAYDGESLWVGGNAEDESIYQLNPENGEILSEIINIKTEGIALLDEYVFYSNDKNINKIEKNGTLVEEITTKNSSYTIPDIAINNNNLYYLRYSENEPIIKLNLSDKKESKIPIAESIGTYCLTIFNDEIITVNPSNEISHFNLQTGAFISTETTEIKGWITAIAPFDQK
ncbi:hypothetical protein APS56_14150 [Pseudalgibacter alginicilyticus]|uniref:Prolow-density lipoprotein receptor-related protein 1-like beta-propeller domain-containing protein n=1 Tax=Pseudalgibacter alginicilyticus TaxID=1736674 RepID=A0A0P0D5L0_9FLAO|nr:DUF5050 domain-containing protein [Pseudalgibacter alginicilyticus]ALJ06204.1 hypothetical protein APS56_14150 [Pseudalgibacter alginicilyticus]